MVLDARLPVTGNVTKYKYDRFYVGELVGDASTASAIPTGGVEGDQQTLADWVANPVFEAGQMNMPAKLYDLSGTNSAADTLFWAVGQVYVGTTTDPAHGINSHGINYYVSGDTADADTTGITHISVYAAASVGRKGIRQGIQGYVAIVGTGHVDSSDNAGVGVSGICRISANQNGTTGAYTNYKGGGFGGNSNIFTSSGATFLGAICSHEFNTSLKTGSSAAGKFGITIIKGASDTVRGVYNDAAIMISDQSGATATWVNGIMFGGYAQQWSLGNDSTMISAVARVLPAPGTPLALYGIDFSAVTITSGGAGIVMPLITPASAAATGKAGSIVWDANYLYVCTATNTWKRVAVSTW